MLRAKAAAPLDLTDRDRVAPAPRQLPPSYAALDLGTNNCRLLIARRAVGLQPAGLSRGGGFRVIDAFSRIVRLGEGLAATGALSAAAMARTLEALRICAGKIGQRKVVLGRYVATEACRRAENCADFLTQVREAIGIATRDHLDRRRGAARRHRLCAAVTPAHSLRDRVRHWRRIDRDRLAAARGGARPAAGRKFSARRRCRTAS